MKVMVIGATETSGEICDQPVNVSFKGCVLRRSESINLLQDGEVVLQGLGMGSQLFRMRAPSLTTLTCPLENPVCEVALKVISVSTQPGRTRSRDT